MKTERLRPTAAGIERAAELLRQGQVVGIPTETVYGLAANALDDRAVAGIFAAKGRPQDNPLIIHISQLHQLEDLTPEVPENARRLARAFWPGPLTMVLKKRPCIPDRTSAGLDTVGIRMPAHPAARAIIDAAGVPLAAPSANTSGKPSPTTARDVLDDMAGRIPAVVDGGPCAVGVESTVVDLTGPRPRVLRPGAITEEMIARVCGGADTDRATLSGLEAGAPVRSPGMKYRHYAPKAPITLLEGAPDETFAALMDRLDAPYTGVICFEEYLPAVRQKRARLVYSLGYSWDHAEHARRLFSLLRQFDRTGARQIVAQCPRALGANAGAVNRLRKAAGFQSVDCRRGPKVLGVTGRSGSGKSLLSARLAQKGALVLDADAIYKELLATDRVMLEQLEARFPGVIRDGQLDRKALAAIAFSDEQARLDLNAITHGRVRQETGRRLRETDAPFAVVDVPLLFESGIDRFCHLTAAILADTEGSVARIMKRDGIDRQRALARLSSQPDDGFYRARADLLVENDGDLESFQSRVDQLCRIFLD